MGTSAVVPTTPWLRKSTAAAPPGSGLDHTSHAGMLHVASHPQGVNVALAEASPAMRVPGAPAQAVLIPMSSVLPTMGMNCQRYAEDVREAGVKTEGGT